MFSEAYTYLNRALAQTQQADVNYYAVRDTLKGALLAVESDARQSQALRQQAAQYIRQAISYTESVRPNPMPAFGPMSFQSMATPISPYERASMGPDGFTMMSPVSVPQAWTPRGRESQALQLMIRAAINIVRQGLI